MPTFERAQLVPLASLAKILLLQGTTKYLVWIFFAIEHRISEEAKMFSEIIYVKFNDIYFKYWTRYRQTSCLTVGSISLI